jgi:hypothetical protein
VPLPRINEKRIMTQLSIDYDISRGRNNRQSKAAHERVRPHKSGMAEQCLWEIACSGKEGLTLEDLCARFQKLPHQLSGRLSELKAAGGIFDSGRTRNGHTVYVSGANR